LSERAELRTLARSSHDRGDVIRDLGPMRRSLAASTRLAGGRVLPIIIIRPLP
jgi:hypothetical protein